jgi:hypothetical protein
MQDTQEKLIAHRQDSVNFTAGERRVQEESNLDILLAVTDLLAQHLRQQHQVVVVDPDQIAVLNFFCDSLGEKPICFLVCLPGGLVKGDFTGVVVE